MSRGDLAVEITDLAGSPIGARVDIDFARNSGDSGTGGEPMTVSAAMDSATDLVVTGIPCRAGPGTLYRVRASAPHYRVYGFFQLIQEDRVNTAHDRLEFWVKPGDVKEIRAPLFNDLPGHLQVILDSADMRREKDEDRDLLGLSGPALYDGLGPKRKACLLNVAKKASHATSAKCFRFIRKLLICRQDRCFAFVDPSLPQRLRESPVYRSAPNALHKPLLGFEMVEGSFKTHPDPHANLQVTFMRETQTGRLAADIDIDEASGIEHGFEVIRNAVFRKRTNPYLIREFMLSADLVERTLDPGYQFVF